MTILAAGSLSPAPREERRLIPGFLLLVHSRLRRLRRLRSAVVLPFSRELRFHLGHMTCLTRTSNPRSISLLSTTSRRPTTTA